MRSTLGGAVLACAVVAFCTSAIGATVLPPAMVSGHTLTSVGGAERTVSLSAMRHSDGSATGLARIDSSATGISLVMEVNCLVVVGNVGRISGEVTHSNSSSLIGSNVVFHVEDNGQTPADPPDRVSSGFITSSTCETFVIPAGHPGSLAPIDRGAVRVHE